MASPLPVVVLVAAMLLAHVHVSGAETDDSKSGYIDSAIIQTQMRFRFDAGYGNPFPDRAEFFYAKCGCLSDGQGPALEESNVDFQEIETYLELALARNFSTFVEIPVRFIDPERNANANGLGDVRAGFRYGLIDEPDRWLTFQLRAYFPSGEGQQGLGTEHFSLEPGMLFQRNFDRLLVFSEFRSWIPFSSSTEAATTMATPDPVSFEAEYSATVIRYGVGFAFDLFRSPPAPVIRGQSPGYPQSYNAPGYSTPSPFTSYRQRSLPPVQSHTPYPMYQSPDACYEQAVSCPSDSLAAVVELVGWTVTGGLKSNTVRVESALNDTIVNLKVGLRWSTARDTFYIGYGRGLTDELWYQDILRAEYAIRF